MLKLCVFVIVVQAMLAPSDQALLPTLTRIARQNQPQATNVNNPTPDPFQLADCIRTCPATSEYNPVCGDNNKTYDNPGRLRCAQACGESVQQLRVSRC